MAAILSRGDELINNGVERVPVWWTSRILSRFSKLSRALVFCGGHWLMISGEFSTWSENSQHQGSILLMNFPSQFKFDGIMVILFCLGQILFKDSLHNFAHVMTAQLSCHLSNLNCKHKIVIEIGPQNYSTGSQTCDFSLILTICLESKSVLRSAVLN